MSYVDAARAALGRLRARFRTRTPSLPLMYPGGLRIGAEEEAAVLQVLRSKRLFRYYGPHPGPSTVDAFEAAFCKRIGVRHGVAMSSGTSALVAGVSALGVGPGDEVIVPAFTWISSASAVVAAGAVPVVADIDASLTLDPDDVERRITPYTKAILPVHMRGTPCRMDRLMAIADRHRLVVLEDVAQAAGGSFRGAALGTIGHIGAFSFQYNKLITAGEGGMAVTNDADLHGRLLLYHDVAAAQRNGIPPDAELPGLTLRMSELHGAVLGVQLRRVDDLLARMRAHKRAIKTALDAVAARGDITFRTLHDVDGDTGIALVFFVDTPTRAQSVTARLRAKGIGAMVLYDPSRPDYHVYTDWTAIVSRRAWSTHGGPWRHHPRAVDYSRDACRTSLDLLGRTVHIDVSPDLTDAETRFIAASLVEVLQQV